jgi:hypothetical protein
LIRSFVAAVWAVGANTLVELGLGRLDLQPAQPRTAASM